MSGLKTVAEQLKDAHADNESLRTQVATLTAERDQARTELSAAAQNTETLKAELAATTASLVKAEAEKTAAEDRANSEATRAETEKARAEKAEKKLALDPGHIEVSGRTEPVGDGTTAGDGKSILTQYNAITDRKERRAFYEANRKAIEAEIRENKKG